MITLELPRIRHVKSRKWYRRRNKWLFARESKPILPPLDAQRLEWLCDADRATWEDRMLLLPDRFMYKLGDVLRVTEVLE